MKPTPYQDPGRKIILSCRHPFHYIAGAVAGYFSVDYPAPCITATALFITYEVKQDKDLRSWAIRKTPDSHKDIYEFVVTFFAGMVARIIQRGLGYG